MFQEEKETPQVPPVDDPETDWTGHERPGNDEEPPTSVQPPDKDIEHPESEATK